jgi:hypothetical protein
VSEPVISPYSTQAVRTGPGRFMKTLAALFLCLAFAPSLWAADWYGVWTSPTYPGMTMTIEPYGAGGSRITYRFKMDAKESVMIIESALDGSDAAVMVDGKSSGETMAIKRLDDRHTYTVIKMNGQPFGTSKCEISADGNALNVENTQPPSPGSQSVQKTQIWNRK